MDAKRNINHDIPLTGEEKLAHNKETLAGETSQLPMPPHLPADLRRLNPKSHAFGDVLAHLAATAMGDEEAAHLLSKVTGIFGMRGDALAMRCTGEWKMIPTEQCLLILVATPQGTDMETVTSTANITNLLKLGDARSGG